MLTVTAVRGDAVGADAATLEAPVTEPNAVTPGDTDGGTAVANPDSPADAAKVYEDRTPEQIQAAEIEAFYIATGKTQPPRGTDGKFEKPTGKIPLKPDAESEADAPAEEVTEEAETPEQREKIVAAKRALRRDEWTADEIEGLSASQLLTIGSRRSAAQAKIDAKFAELSEGSDADPAATKAAQEKAEQEEATYAVPLPPDVLEYLNEPDREKLTTHITQHVMRATKAAETVANQARRDIFEERCVGVQEKLAEKYPALKGQPPPEFLAKFHALVNSGSYQTDTREGAAELMEDTALIVFGKNHTAQVQQSMLTKNRAALNGQPDPKTLTAKTGKGTLTRLEYETKAFEVARSGVSQQEQHESLHKWVAGREVKD